jgi:aspartokinase-like uncharacterized kinase
LKNKFRKLWEDIASTFSEGKAVQLNEKDIKTLLNFIDEITPYFYHKYSSKVEILSHKHHDSHAKDRDSNEE